jgi:hypothetical protein
MRVEDHMQSFDGSFSESIPPPRQPFCLQPGHKDAVARHTRPDFARRLKRGEEGRVVSYFVITAVVWFPSAVIFGTLGGLISRAVGGTLGWLLSCTVEGEAFFLAGLIGGSLVLPIGCVCAGIAGLREVRRRAELYSRGQLVPGRVTACTASDDYYCNPSNPDAMPERTGASVVTVWYDFQTPLGRRIEDKARAVYRELPQPRPDGETPVAVLYLDDDRYEVL